jgi:hypothetical protein
MPFTAYSLNVRHPSLSPSQYRTYLETTHAPLLIRLISNSTPNIGLWTYTRHYTPTTGPNPIPIMGPKREDGQWDWEYDCITRLEFKDEAGFRGFEKAFGENAKVIGEDEERFMNRKKTRFLIVGEGCSDEIK